MSEQLGFDFTEGPGSVVPRPDAREPPTSGKPHLIGELRALTDAHPLARKVLIGSTRGQGRELLRQLTLRGTPWIGWEATTLGPLATEIAGVEIARRRLEVIDDFELTRLVDEAVDQVLLARRVSGFSELAETLGFRRAVRDAVSALRLAGIDAATVRKTWFASRVKRGVLADVLAAYDGVRESGGYADTADLLSMALAQLEAGLPVDGILVVLPGLSERGLGGRLLRRLVEDHDARCVATDPVEGLAPPARTHWRSGPAVSTGSFLHRPAVAVPRGLVVATFAATTISEELREALRRVVAGRHAWDQVEIVTPDPMAYGSALHQMAERLGIPVTFGVGLPIGRTRPGRVVTEYFRWLDSGFSADVIRGLLEAGDLRPPDGPNRPGPMELGRRFRQLRIGWGRARYLRRIDRWLGGLEGMSPSRYESEARMERRRTLMRSELTALRAILAPPLEAIPAGVPDPAAGPGSSPVTPAGIALGLGRFLDRVEARDTADETALLGIRQVLERIVATLERPSEYPAAAAIVRAALDIRVPSPREEGKAPWTTRPGHLHLTDVDHGGWTGRPVTFVVGMDAGRFPGAGRQDPLLMDSERGALAPDDLPTASHRLAETAFSFASLMARLRGTVTVSYAAWEPTEGRELSPATELLGAYRLASGNPEALFEHLRAGLGRPAGIVPVNAAWLDAQDVWMANLLRPGAPRDSRRTVAEAFPEHVRGAQAVEAHQRPAPSSWTGQLEPRPMLDPRVDRNRVVSATALEALGACPRRYLFKSVLGLRPPDDPTFDPDRWLTALDRGGLLHRVYERTLRACRERGDEPDDDGFLQEALRVLSREIAHARDVHPTPSAEVRERERRALEEDVRSFVTLVAERGAHWRSLERKFGFDDVPPVEVKLYQGSMELRGAIDRIDDLDDGLLVVDYKTGSAYTAEGDTGTFHGGRRLQNVLYTMAARELEDAPVARMEYHYPTRKARNTVLGFTPKQLASGPFLIDRMLDGVRAGAFPPTDDPDDCRWCDFRSLCRVRGEGDRSESPFAEWTRSALSAEGGAPELLRSLRDVRQEERYLLAVPLEQLRERS